MAVLIVRGPIRDRAGGRGEHALAGDSVLELLRSLEREYPALSGWVLDERGAIRRHINIYVNGERGDATTALQVRDRVDVVPAITGG
ncbi:MAG TPA: MoaD/ThiS family protein [Solirubrobacteraceae bacterium]|nr:MoaD/ThiS family protein [Solirubrobacteraceae bacterium]